MPHIAGAPRFLYRQLLQQTWRWLGMAARRDALGTLIEELQVIEYAGAFKEYWRRWISRGFETTEPLDPDVHGTSTLPVA